MNLMELLRFAVDTACKYMSTDDKIKYLNEMTNELQKLANEKGIDENA